MWPRVVREPRIPVSARYSATGFRYRFRISRNSRRFPDEIDGEFQSWTAFVGALFVVMPTFRIRQDVMAAERRAEKYPAAGLADDRNIIVERAGAAAGIQNGCRAVSKRAIQGILPPHSDRLRRRRFHFLFKRCAENKPVCREIIF